MLDCPACSAPAGDLARFCASCGSPLDGNEAHTGTAPRPASPLRTPAATPARTGSAAVPLAGRFVPGALLGERYRIVALLGKGGMGEVYRADDLRLAQPVALKFLPEAMGHDEERLDRFYNEVRVARQVAHPNVCRVYDVGEMDGLHFLSMEFVDGEDLASLLRRIGRLPSHKALEIARQLCAGMGAAHDRGVLHRDLKPENVMIDGRGKVRITDFGLAALAEAVSGPEARSGTPAYMSPEQLTGREATQRSDVYAMGLVLFEAFTGHRAFDGRTFVELLRQHRDAAPPRPTELVADLDPAVEQAILRCLEKDPARRPPSALAVAAALPGGDPLAAALAAGETPSPEMVAAAGDLGGLSPRVAASLAALGALSAVLVVWLGQPFQLTRIVPLDKPPAVLEDRAQEILATLGPHEPAADASRGFLFDGDYYVWAGRRDEPRPPWDRVTVGQPPLIQFWYRQSPRLLVPLGGTGRISSNNPPLVVSGMAGVRLDSKGRLVAFYRVPAQREEGGAGAPAPDWAPLFAAARFDRSTFREAAPQWNPPFSYDARTAWEGSYPDRPDIPIRLEAAAWRGRPVWFQIVAPWTRAERTSVFRATTMQRASAWMAHILLLCLVAGAAWLARRNLSLGRGDRRGATRLATAAVIVILASWALHADHVADVDAEIDLVSRGLGRALVSAGLLWLFYVALEPPVRRLWPDTLISWARLVSGQLRDPLVGAHTLVGLAAGGLMSLSIIAAKLVAQGLGEPAAPTPGVLETLLGVRQSARWFLERAFFSTALALSMLLLLVGLRFLLRRQWLVVGVATVLASLPDALSSGISPLVSMPFSMLLIGIGVWVLSRYGLLPLALALLVLGGLMSMPLRTDLAHWSATPTVVLGSVLLALLAYGTRTASVARTAR